MSAIAQFASWILDPTNLWIILCSGLGVLALALLVLMLSRWGQARPVSKCIALSVLAHLLLVGYAYTTKLLESPQIGPLDRPVQVKLAIDHQQPNPPEPERIQDWDQPQPSAITEPESLAMLRSKIAPPELPEPIEEPAEEAWTSPVPEAVWADDEPKTETFQEEDSEPNEQPHMALFDATAIVIPASSPATPAPTVEELSNVESVRPPSLPTDLHPQDQHEASERNQEEREIDESPNSDETADALASNRDRPVASTQTATSGIPLTENSATTATTHGTQARTGIPIDRTNAHALTHINGRLLPKPYQARVGPDRLKSALQRGGNANTEAAVESALAWLARSQSTDGRWDADLFGSGRETHVLGHNRYGAGGNADTGITGLATLVFLAAGHTHLQGEYRKHVQHALEFILASQRYDGFLAGNSSLYARMYCHGMATLAVSEAFAMTADARIEPYLRRAVNFTVSSQHPSTGGWRYRRGDTGDMSQFGWQLMVLSSAELAGIPIPSTTKLGMQRFLQSVSSGHSGGLASYRSGERISPTMTAEALVCRLFLDHDDIRKIQEAEQYLLNHLPDSHSPDLYYWYYATLALSQRQSDAWSIWNDALQNVLLATQRTDGPAEGSWDPNGRWASYGGRVYSTAMATLCLESYYRYLPMQK